MAAVTSPLRSGCYIGGMILRSTISRRPDRRPQPVQRQKVVVTGLDSGRQAPRFLDFPLTGSDVSPTATPSRKRSIGPLSPWPTDVNTRLFLGRHGQPFGQEARSCLDLGGSDGILMGSTPLPRSTSSPGRLETAPVRRQSSGIGSACLSREIGPQRGGRASGCNWITPLGCPAKLSRG